MALVESSNLSGEVPRVQTADSVLLDCVASGDRAAVVRELASQPLREMDFGTRYTLARVGEFSVEKALGADHELLSDGSLVHHVSQDRYDFLDSLERR